MHDTTSLTPFSQVTLRERRSSSVLALFVSFLAGALIGIVRVRFFQMASPFWTDLFSVRLSSEADLIWAFWASSWIVFVVLAFSASFIGCFFIPVIFFFLGWLLVYQICDVIPAGGYGLASLLRFSCPVFLSLSALFLIGEESLDASSELFRLIRSPGRSVFRGVSGERMILSLFLLLLSAVSRRYLLPLLS
jgi:hypothetical protein